mgnify:FL=1
MKQVLFCVLFLILPAIPCRAETVYSVEILQVGNLLSFDQLCQSTVKGLEKHGLVREKTSLSEGPSSMPTQRPASGKRSRSS